MGAVHLSGGAETGSRALSGCQSHKPGLKKRRRSETGQRAFVASALLQPFPPFPQASLFQEPETRIPAEQPPCLARVPSLPPGCLALAVCGAQRPNSAVPGPSTAGQVSAGLVQDPSGTPPKPSLTAFNGKRPSAGPQYTAAPLTWRRPRSRPGCLYLPAHSFPAEREAPENPSIPCCPQRSCDKSWASRDVGNVYRKSACPSSSFPYRDCLSPLPSPPLCSSLLM